MAPNDPVGPETQLLETQLRRACRELEDRLRAGDPCRAEEWLARSPALASASESVLDLIYAEYLVRLELGERALAEEFYQRFPQWRAALEEQFRLHRWLDDAATATPPPGGVGGGHPGSDGIGADEPGRFEVLEEVGRGGMGVVYRARERETGRTVALKMILNGPHANREELERFRKEEEAIARLHHPNVVDVHWVGEYQGWPSLALEFVGGGTLAARIDGRPLPPREAAALVESLARAVHHAHQRGVLHRDITPRNILLTEDGVPKLTDFGLAKLFDAQDGTLAGPTRTVSVLGTPQYAAPEQLKGRSKAGPAADVYGLGAVLYEALTGRPPFRAETVVATLRMVETRDPVRPRRLRRDVPRDLETVCLKCLRKEPQERYASAEDLADDLRRFLDGETVVARPVSLRRYGVVWARRHPAVASLLSVVAVVTLLASGVSTWQWWRTEGARREAADRAEAEARAREELADSLYFFNVALAEREWSAGNLRRADELLAGCDLGRRGWEWNYLRRQRHAPVPPIEAHTQAVFSVAWSPDGGRLATAGRDRGEGSEVKLWDPAAGRTLQTFRGHVDSVRRVAWSPDGRRVATASRDGTARLWDAATGETLHTLRGHEGPVWDVAFGPDGRRVATASHDQTVRLWEADTGREVRALRGHADKVLGVAFSRDGSRVASAGLDDTARIWDVSAGHEVHTLRGHGGSVWRVAFSPDGRLLASSSHDQTVKLWDVGTGHEVRTLRGHVGYVYGLAFSPDGSRLATGSWDKTVKLWDTAIGAEALTLRGHRDNVLAVAFSPDGQRLASAGNDGTVRVWDASPPAPAGGEGAVYRDAAVRLSVAFSPDGRHLAAGGGDGSVRVWDARSGQPAALLTGHGGDVLSVAYAQDGRLASGSEDKLVKVWDAASGKELRTLRGHTDKVRAVAWTPDGRLVGSAAEDQTVRVWEADTGREVHVLRGHDLAVVGLAFSPDGRRLASAGWDRLVKVWDVEVGREVLTVEGNTLSVWCVAFSPDGERLATAGADTTVRVWDGSSGRELAALRGHGDRVFGAAFSPDGARVASAGEDQTVRLWDAATGREVANFRGHTDQVWGVAFSPDGRSLASVSKDGTVRLWDLTAAP